LCSPFDFDSVDLDFGFDCTPLCLQDPKEFQECVEMRVLCLAAEVVKGATGCPPHDDQSTFEPYPSAKVMLHILVSYKCSWDWGIYKA
jgi:hypothetical protein